MDESIDERARTAEENLDHPIDTDKAKDMSLDEEKGATVPHWTELYVKSKSPISADKRIVEDLN